MKKKSERKNLKLSVLEKRQSLISQVRFFIRKDLKRVIWDTVAICIYLVLFTGLAPFLFFLAGGISGEEVIEIIAIYTDPFDSPHNYILLSSLFFAVMVLFVDEEWGNNILFNSIDSIRFLPTAYWLLKVCKLLEEYRIDSPFNRRNLKLSEKQVTEMLERRKSINPWETKDLITSWNVVSV